VFFVFFTSVDGYLAPMPLVESLKGPRFVAVRSVRIRHWSGFFEGLDSPPSSHCAYLSIQRLPAGSGCRDRDRAVIVGAGGDLFESAMKRRFGVKDSGNFDPRPWWYARSDRCIAMGRTVIALYA